ncbi:uncharacterized protein EDB93DRAFT_1108607 [Suillus bovinus]|uniref:uncharacterized protein n=1 Tax=Suillus bovinus TaxID=48563 RepID=UPI001B86DAF8|nr:uncharacterized protein EDB93DRAFT_1108607 [Suillus bovinus]KAG2129677.1 hypothetical protein EDB93DRAFT_1108607 [Suillus bovinus]
MQDINTYQNNHTYYAHHSFVMVQKHDWNHTLQDAIKAISPRALPSAEVIGHIRNTRVAFDVASMYTEQDSQTIYFLLLIKVIVLFNADQYDKANLLLKELTTGCLNADNSCISYRGGNNNAYLCIQLGLKALDSTCHDEAAEHFIAALNSSALPSKSGVHDIYKDLMVLFDWNLKSLWLTSCQKRCDALLQADKLLDAIKSYRFLMDDIDKKAKASCLEWSNGKSRVFNVEQAVILTTISLSFHKKCSALVLTRGHQEASGMSSSSGAHYAKKFGFKNHKLPIYNTGHHTFVVHI